MDPTLPKWHQPPISSNKTIYALDGSIYRKLRCVIFLKMVSKNYSNILREFSEKLTEKLREFTHQQAYKVNI